jgi:glutathione S-transferase
MRRWYDAALTETWRDQAHEEETLHYGDVVEDLRLA